MSEVLPGENDDSQVLQNTALPPHTLAPHFMPASLPEASSLLLLQGSPGKLFLVEWRCEKRKSSSVSAGSLGSVSSRRDFEDILPNLLIYSQRKGRWSSAHHDDLSVTQVLASQ